MIFTIDSPKYGLKEVQIDDEDWPLVSQYNHGLDPSPLKNNFYALCKKKGRSFRMHRIILNLHDRRFVVDHIDHDTLNNRKSNLRICLSKENTRNMKKNKENESSDFKGVYFNKKNGRYSAYINCDEQRYRLGQFSYADEAAIEYNKKAVELFGEFAYLNEVPEISKEEIERRQKEYQEKEDLIKRNHRGVYYWDDRGKYQVQIKIKGIKKTVGYYDSEEEAVLNLNRYCDLMGVPERKVLFKGEQK